MEDIGPGTVKGLATSASDLAIAFERHGQRITDHDDEAAQVLSTTLLPSYILQRIPKIWAEASKQASMSSLPPRGSKQKPSARKTLQRLSTPSPSPDLTPERKFDRETGQVYSEIEVRPNRSKNHDWVREFSTPNIVVNSGPNAKGSRSLADLARSKVVKESRNLSPEHFASIPWALAEEVWEQTVKMCVPL